MENKPALKSVTLWSNLFMALFALFCPLADQISPEVQATIIAGVNAIIRVVLTNKGIGGVV